MRTKNSIINMIVGWGTQFIKIIAGFIARTIFIKYLSAEYLGLSSTFTNVLQILSFAELGIGGAILVSFFKPIAEGDYEEQIALFQLHKKIFRIIGIVVAVLGIFFTPFLNFFIKEIPDIPNISFIYILFVLNSAFSYFTAHKSTYFTAVQKNYVIRLVHSCVYIFMLIIQCIILIFTQNYILYLLMQISATIAENLIWSLLIRRYYPFLNVKEKKEISSEEKKKLMTNMKAVVFFKVGHVIVNSTDNLILSKYVGLIAAGIYSNYFMVITAVDSILNQIFGAMTASIGDLHVSADSEKQKGIFEKIMFLGFALYAVSMVVLMGVMNDIIFVWLGKEYVFSFSIVSMLLISFYIQGNRKVLGIFREACGLYDYTKYTTFFEAVVNFILSVVFVKMLGISGIFFGTIISHLLFGFWKEPLVIYKHVFEINVKEYWRKYLRYVLVLFVLLVITQYMSSLIIADTWLLIIVKSIAIFCTSSLAVGIIFYRTSEFKFYMELAIKIIHNKSRQS